MSSSDVEAMREEFAKRLSSTEKKLQAVIKASEGTYNSLTNRFVAFHSYRKGIVLRSSYKQ